MAYVLTDHQKAGWVGQPGRSAQLREHDHAKHRRNRCVSRFRGDTPCSVY
jgi:hypothetical protein